jgi:serine/threonine protein kinase
MGEVYRARDMRLDRAVAIKVLPATFASDPDHLRRFELEAKATGALNHPNILTIHDTGAYEGMPYIVTELHALLKDGPLPLRQVLDYARQIAQGLAAAHEKGITHRDLKPANLFVTNEGRVEILDFGLAKLNPIKLAGLIGNTEAETMTQVPQTEPGVVVGTVGYRPE